MLEQVDVGRYQVRCACLRSSPILEGSIEDAEIALGQLDWEKRSDGWRCPVCWGRARTQPPRAEMRPGVGGAGQRPTVTMRKTVLLVEDDPDARVIYASTLRHVGYRVIEAPSVKDASVAVQAFLPDAVVLDRRLPDGDGLELVNAWRDSAMGRVPVIVVTAHSDRHDVEAAQQAGADHFVAKPCPGNVLAAHVERAIQAGGPTRRLRVST